MSNDPISIHPTGERKNASQGITLTDVVVDTFDGKVTVKWDSDEAVTPIGQLLFFIEFLKLGHLFEPWVDSCPLNYTSNNAPQKVDVLGSFLLSILSGHNRYSHIASLMGDRVNTQLLGMNKVVSDDSARRALKRMDVDEGIHWLQQHLQKSYEPLLNQPWILDVDATVKPLYGHQDGAKVGYNPHKPGRPSHTYHTYMIANLRLILDVEVQAGTDISSSHSAPGLWSLLERIPRAHWPQFIRGDSDWGTDAIMTTAEDKGIDYLFKMKKSKNVKNLLYRHHNDSEWQSVAHGWEAKESELKLAAWNKKRRVVMLRRRLPKDTILGLEHNRDDQQSFGFIDDGEDINLFEYAVLVTSLKNEVLSIVHHYRDRADCENNFDEIKNHWGWGGFTTRDSESCRLIARITALIYNWWNIFMRLANPDKHMEAITSRPLMLSSIGRMTKHSRQKKIILTNLHGESAFAQSAYQKIQAFFNTLKANAPQLTSIERWRLILGEAMRKFLGDRGLGSLEEALLSG